MVHTLGCLLAGAAQANEHDKWIDGYIACVTGQAALHLGVGNTKHIAPVQAGKIARKICKKKEPDFKTDNGDGEAYDERGSVNERIDKIVEATWKGLGHDK